MAPLMLVYGLTLCCSGSRNKIIIIIFLPSHKWKKNVTNVKQWESPLTLRKKKNSTKSSLSSWISKPSTQHSISNLKPNKLIKRHISKCNLIRILEWNTPYYLKSILVLNRFRLIHKRQASKTEPNEPSDILTLRYKY